MSVVNGTAVIRLDNITNDTVAVISYSCDDNHAEFSKSIVIGEDGAKFSTAVILSI